jgi:hypothetical protein
LDQKLKHKVSPKYLFFMPENALFQGYFAAVSLTPPKETSSRISKWLFFQNSWELS